MTIAGNTKERLQAITPFIGSRITIYALLDTRDRECQEVSITGVIVGVSLRWPKRWRQVVDLVVRIGEHQLRSVSVGRVTRIEVTE